MCGTWTIKQYRDAAATGTEYDIIGEFVNSDGQEAIMVRHNFNVESDIYNIYSTDGLDANTSFWVRSDEDNTQEQLAKSEMTERGFLPKSETVIETVETTNTETTPEDGVVRVQGKTLEEWTEEGRLNEDRDENDHVHPAYPEGREPTEDEVQAYMNSLTTEESEYLDAYAKASILSDILGALA